jgi:hypothetical protein
MAIQDDKSYYSNGELIQPTLGLSGTSDGLSVIDYGAVGDGVTNDQSAIQAAIDAAVAQGGGIVSFPAGTYAIGNHPNNIVDGVALDPDDRHGIRGASNVTFMAHGAKFVTHSSASQQFTTLYYPAGSENCKIYGLEIDGSHHNVAASGDVVNFKTGSNNLVLEDCYIHHGLDDGLDFDGCNAIKVNRCRFSDNGSSGIHGAGSGFVNAVISHCLFERNAYVRGNGVLFPNAAAGIDIWQGQRVIVRDCVMTDNFRALVIFNGSGVSVSGCWMSNSLTHVSNTNAAGLPYGTEALVHMRGGTNGVFGSITGCVINAQTPAYAIRIQDNMDGSTVPGGYVANPYTEALINGNRFMGTGHGIQLFHANKVTIEENYFMHTGAITINDTFTRIGKLYISGNTIFNSGEIQTSNANGVSINNIADCYAFMRFLAGANDWTVDQNVVSGTFACRIYGGSRISCRDNDFTNSQFRVEVHGTANTHTVTRNSIGTLYLLATGVTFRDNEFKTLMQFPGATNKPSLDFWNGNYGAAMPIAQFGTGLVAVNIAQGGASTLVNGTVTVSNGLATASTRILVSRQGINASSAMGSIAVGTITDGTSFVINSLSSTGAVVAGDQSSIYWEILKDI